MAKCRINPLCDKIAHAAQVNPETVHRVAMLLARKLPREMLKA